MPGEKCFSSLQIQTENGDLALSSQAKKIINIKKSPLNESNSPQV